MEENERKPLRVVGYARVSTLEQAEKGYSIEAQVETIKDRCKLFGDTFVDVYVDAGISGKEMTNRKELIRLLADAKTGKFDCVVVWKLNRMSRNTRDLLEIVDALRKENVGFISISEQFDTNTTTGMFILQMLAGIGEFERNTIVDNVRMGLRQRARKGYHNGGSPALGYKLVASTDPSRIGKAELKVVPEEAEIVRGIFSSYLSGMSARAIANKLNNLGHRTKNGKTFSFGGITEILTNPIYKGYIRYSTYKNWHEKRRKAMNPDPILVPGKHEAIVSEDVWDKVNALRNLSSRKISRSMTTCNFLTGLLRCPVCGAAMQVHTTGQRKRKSGKVVNYRHYICGEYCRKGTSVCTANGVVAEEAENYVVSRIKEIFSSKEVFDAILSNVSNRKDLAEESSKELVGVDNRIADVEKKISKLTDVLGECKPEITEIIMDKLFALKKEKAELEVTKAEIKARKPTSPSSISEEYLHKVLANFDAVLNSASKEQKYLFMRLLIDHVSVDPVTRKVDTIYLKLGTFPVSLDCIANEQTLGTTVKNVLVGI